MPSQVRVADSARLAQDAATGFSGEIAWHIQTRGTAVDEEDIASSTLGRSRCQMASVVQYQLDLIGQDTHPARFFVVADIDVQSAVWGIDVCGKPWTPGLVIYTGLPSSLPQIAPEGSAAPGLGTWRHTASPLPGVPRGESVQAAHAATAGGPAGQVVSVDYQGREGLQQLLGDKGLEAVREAVDLTKSMSLRRNWPLRSVRISVQADPEVEDWRYALVVLSFDVAFELADAYLHELYDDLDLFAARLGADAKDILDRKVFFDVSVSAIRTD